ncbi:MAG: RagB/SusD family nutrient uptake outer membrane protein [Marinilabiliales bacterium]|nr:RagB/SusD family nutrient uptake outer membrane protein [Marinilabiliales bacterium]
MKKIFYSIALVFALSVSCSDDLNQIPISQGTTLTFYQSPSDFVQGLNAVYSDLRAYPDRLLNLSEIRSDNIYGVSDLGVRDWDPINSFQKAIAGNTYIEEAWSTDYNGIFRANTVLEQIKLNGSLINSTTLATRMEAEARFLRAFFYFDLVRYFGKVPLIDHTVVATEANTIGRSSVTDVYKLIISDLQSAISNLPASYTGVDVGRATKYAAEGLLALVYMTRSGPTYSIEGPGLGLNEWTLALPLLQDIISSGLFTFNPSFANIFSYANQSPVSTGNKEAIFDVMYISGASGTSSIYGATYPWVLCPNIFFKTLNDTKSNGSLEVIPVSNDLLGKYATTDVRKSFAIHTASYNNAGSTETRPFFQKYLDYTKIPSTSRFDWGINFIAIRYTDILLLKAECVLNGAPGSQSADVDAVVNMVRTRAGIGATPLVNVTLPQLFEERRREFADEGNRWFDLQRSGNIITIMNSWMTVDDAVRKQMNPMVANYIIYPVPQSQLDAMPGLYSQNPGY